MTNSMTGFANEEQKLPQGELAWELRTVNHRFLEVQFKLPEGLRRFERELRELAATKINRGKLDASLQFRPSAGAAAELNINTELARRVIEQAELVNTDISTSSGINPLDILRWPGVIEERSYDVDALLEPAQALLAKALDSLSAARQREGERIEAMLESRLTQISTMVGEVRARLPEVTEAMRQRVAERARSLDARIDPERLEQELVLLAQKLDVAEELDRLDAHVEEARSALATPGPKGRRLDFLMQEFNREANTLGSKSGDPTTSAIAVDLKVLIEQMREQVQNVE